MNSWNNLPQNVQETLTHFYNHDAVFGLQPDECPQSDRMESIREVLSRMNMEDLKLLGEWAGEKLGALARATMSRKLAYGYHEAEDTKRDVIASFGTF